MIVLRSFDGTHWLPRTCADASFPGSLLDLSVDRERWIGFSDVGRKQRLQRNETSAKVLCLDKVYRCLSKLQRPVEALNYTHVLKDGRPTEWHDGERCENEEKGMLSICLKATTC
jgi:hypothetical protein